MNADLPSRPRGANSSNGRYQRMWVSVVASPGDFERQCFVHGLDLASILL